MSKRSDLFREYARVIDLCEGTNVNPSYCVRIDNQDNHLSGLSFLDKTTAYTFALAIVEDEPVFAGDVLYGENRFKVTVTSKLNTHSLYAEEFPTPILISSLTWTKPDESNTVSLSNVFGISNEIIKVKVTKSGTGKISAEVVE